MRRNLVAGDPLATIVLEAGHHTIHCGVPGHREATTEATLEVG